MTSGEEDGGGSPQTTTTTKKTTKKRKTLTHVAFYERRDSLWDVIVKWDDICFKHILPRLNRTDVKFLHEVNTETRKLIKRSSRKRELKKKFKVSEMSSISTLEVAWEHKSLWSGYLRDEGSFCWQVAGTNKLELLKWAREWKHCKWDSKTMRRAAEQGNLEMVKYCVANECPINGWACAEAAGNGHLEVLKYLHEEAKAPWNLWTAAWAARSGHLHVLEYLVERKFEHFDRWAYRCAAKPGQLDCLKFLHETAKAPWDSEAVGIAHENKQTECLQYLLDNNCPLPRGWRYEGGELRVPE
jgi:hypothetical protein